MTELERTSPSARVTLPQAAAGPEPLIIPRSEHCISRADIDVEVLKVLYRLHHNDHLAYLVGGSVRDLLLGKKPKDFDIATDAHPQEIRRLFRNSRIIGRRFRLVQVFFKGGKAVEVSTFRRRSEFDGQDEVLAPNNTFGTPAEDAQRRDLTINGLFYNIADFSIIDYVGGLADLRQRLIRVIGPPDIRFHRDPVRMLRVLRHAARTGFTIDPAAWSAILAQRQLIRLCNPSRVRDELLKDFRSGACAPFLDLMLASGLLAAILPALELWQQEPLILTAMRRRLQEVFLPVDQLVQAEVSCSEAFFWTAFLLPFLEAASDKPYWQMDPEATATLLATILRPLEFAPSRREDIMLLWHTAAQIQKSTQAGQRLAARLRRRRCFPEAWLLAHLLAGAPAEVLREFAAQPAPTLSPPEPPPVKKRRRSRRPRPRKP